jgi:hypothetical protein
MSYAKAAIEELERAIVALDFLEKERSGLTDDEKALLSRLTQLLGELGKKDFACERDQGRAALSIKERDQPVG